MTEEQINNLQNKYIIKQTNICDFECRNQKLTFRTLKHYFFVRGLHLNDETFEDNLN